MRRVRSRSTRKCKWPRNACLSAVHRLVPSPCREGKSRDGGHTADSQISSGGGGGTGGLGEDGSAGGTGYGGDGGIGTISTIISASQATSNSVGEVVSSNVYFGGGGGGSYFLSGSPGIGGHGGGADGTGYNGDGTDASANTGGGGSGAHTSGGQGGSGVVIIRLNQTATSTQGSPTQITDGNDTIYIFKSAGSLTI